LKTKIKERFVPFYMERISFMGLNMKESSPLGAHPVLRNHPYTLAEDL
jgi:hypothetical protein